MQNGFNKIDVKICYSEGKFQDSLKNLKVCVSNFLNIFSFIVDFLLGIKLAYLYFRNNSNAFSQYELEKLIHLKEVFSL